VKVGAGTRAVVTGGGSGLGAALCTMLAGRGARVIAADLDEPSAQAVAARCGAGAHAVRCDVSKLADVEALGEAADRLLGGVDLVINNAGVAVAGKVGEVPIEDWRWIVDINLWGVIHGCHVFAPRLEQQRHGHIVNVASAAGLLAPPRMAPYNVTKAAVVALSETMHADLRPAGVGVTALCPTFFKTNLTRTARTAGNAGLKDKAKDLVEKSKVTAESIARATLEGVERDAMIVQPQADGRWMWRLKRLAPQTFPRLTGSVAARLINRRP
jgi:NAD(P)-dependent dehydrogenase (short-subunit alcohol dehydrogenase family)